FLGYSVAISGDTVVGGAPDKAGHTGAAYVFVRAGVAWMEEAKLTASDAAPNQLGWSVAISGDTVAVAGFGAAMDTGAAYVYVNTAAADLLVNLNADKTTVRQGDTLTYTLTIKNFGPNRALNNVVTETLSSGAIF